MTGRLTPTYWFAEIRRKGEIVSERAITQQRTSQRNRSKARCLELAFLSRKKTVANAYHRLSSHHELLSK